MKDDDLFGASVTVDLSDLGVSDINSIDEIDMISLDSIANVAPPSYNYGSYTYPNGASSVSLAGSGSSTSIYTSPSIPSITISPNTYTNSSWATAPLTVNGDTGITVKGDADIQGTLKVNGVDLSEMLLKIQDQLAIYQPAPELEEKWEQLRDLARQYKDLVADIKEKEKIWNILQK